MSELSAVAGSERYAACADEGGVPNPGGIRAAFLDTSSFFMAPPSAVTTGSKEVGLPYSGSPGALMLYSSAWAGSARAHTAHRHRAVVSRVFNFFTGCPPRFHSRPHGAS